MQSNSRGCCIYAYNTDTIDYFSQAVEAADRVNRYLDLPVTIFTNKPQKSKHNIIVTALPEPNYRFKNIWHNRSRTESFNNSPYNKTLVIDSDYFLCSDTLKYHFESSKPFLIAQEIYEPASGKLITNNLGKTHIPMMWATVMMFDRSDEAHAIFECAKHIEKHYLYYATYYGFKEYPIRNDYIFSIACHLMGGYGQKSYALKNYPLVNCEQTIAYESWNGSKLIYKYAKDKVYGNRLQNMDLHLMNKEQL